MIQNFIKIGQILIFFLFAISNLISKTLKVGADGDYSNLSQAADFALPNDTILLQGTFSGGDYINNLQGEENKWIYIISDPQNPARFSGGNTAFQLSDVSYLHIKGITFEAQKVNGVNIDDGGSYESPSHHIIIENCSWLSMNATGNNDELKLSGLDDFQIVGCTFQNGSAGGSLIDMVGCHNGIIRNNTFNNAGSNCIQAKGGTRFVTIEQNWFYNGGQRSINIGGSTGLDFFRPKDANYEASDIFVYSNVFIGSVAPIAFVGSVNCKVINNTLINPSRWLVRILQENTNTGFLTCGNNTFANNICYFNNSANNELGINIGPNTSPETFFFYNNLWYNSDNQNWTGPNKNIIHLNSIINSDPLFRDRFESDFDLQDSSPAIAKGMDVAFPEKDYKERLYKNPRSIGAYEYYSNNSFYVEPTNISSNIKAYYNKKSSKIVGTILLKENDFLSFHLYSQIGVSLIETQAEHYDKGLSHFEISLDKTIPLGVYLIHIKGMNNNYFALVIIDQKY
jgi:hypothetical protein